MSTADLTVHEDVPVPRDGTVRSTQDREESRTIPCRDAEGSDPLVRQARAAVAAEQQAHRVWQEALEARREAFRRAWPVIADQGPRAFARRVGVGESRVRAATVDLAARARRSG